MRTAAPSLSRPAAGIALRPACVKNARFSNSLTEERECDDAVRSARYAARSTATMLSRCGTRDRTMLTKTGPVATFVAQVIGQVLETARRHPHEAGRLYAPTAVPGRTIGAA